MGGYFGSVRPELVQGHRSTKSGHLGFWGYVGNGAPIGICNREKPMTTAPMTYDLVLTGGTLLDPAQGIHDRRDIAFKDGHGSLGRGGGGDSIANHPLPERSLGYFVLVFGL